MLVITSEPFSDTLHAELKGLNRDAKKKKKKMRELSTVCAQSGVTVFTSKP